MNDIVTRDELCRRIQLVPQVDIGHFPTPLEECPRLSEELGGPPHFYETRRLFRACIWRKQSPTVDFHDW